LINLLTGTKAMPSETTTISISTSAAPMRAQDFLSAKARGQRLSMVTCYDYTFARLLRGSAVDAILVGDSAAMVVHGHSSTLTATVDLMRIHTEAVARGVSASNPTEPAGKFIVSDMPFLSFRKGVAAALDAAQELMIAGANAVKLEGVDGHEDVIERLTQSGIPVMGHLGLQPQSVRAYGGYQVQGRSAATAREISRQARALEELGAFAVVLECIPSGLAREVTASLRIPTIGIGAGDGCDGQILVLQDLLGLNIDFRPRFARPFLNGAEGVLDALADFDRAVKAGTFPLAAESY
jgi:3-methyl-2-oxobutanoate hydroxymethyltransferase